MEPVELKLKQASAVLGVSPKDLQNFVQFKILRPRRRERSYWFDNQLLLEAKVAIYLKESLGASTDVLARFTKAFSQSAKQEQPAKSQYMWLRSQPACGNASIDVRIPIRRLANEIEERLPQAGLHRDLPRGRKRPGWKREFTRALDASARCLSGVTEQQIAQAIRGYRRPKKRSPEITVGSPKRPA